MKTKIRAIPEGYHNITPYIIVKNAAKAIDFYKTALGARERMRMPGPNNKIMHAEIQIGDSAVMLADEMPEMGAKSPESFGGCPITLYLYDEDVDARVKQAISAGAESVRPVEDQFYGDRSGIVKDPFGYTWHIATHKEDLTPEEMEKRRKAAGH